MIREFRTQEGIFEAGPNDVLGKGTYGTVYRATLKNNPKVKRAIKTFVAETMDESEGVPSTTLREVNAVKSISHPNVMSVREVVIPSTGPLTEMFVVMDLCRGTLKDKIQTMILKHLNGDSKWAKLPPATGKDGTCPLRLPDEYVREAKLVSWQILNALAVCHSRGIMHRDLKPANILWSDDDLLKIADFGLARFVRGRPISDDHIVPQTGEVQTMWYRAPEVLLGDERYGMLVDDWSIGCVIAEMFRFRISVSNQRVEPDPLFAGRGDIHTLLLIFETLGTPFNEPYLKKLPYWSDFFPAWHKGNLRQKVRLIDPLGYDLICQLLRLSPTDRRASRFLLNHEWFNDVKADLKNARYVPWYAGHEKEFLRLLEVDRMPCARPLKPEERPARVRATTTTASSSNSNSGPNKENFPINDSGVAKGGSRNATQQGGRSGGGGQQTSLFSGSNNVAPNNQQRRH